MRSFAPAKLTTAIMFKQVSVMKRAIHDNEKCKNIVSSKHIKWMEVEVCSLNSSDFDYFYRRIFFPGFHGEHEIEQIYVVSR